MKIYRKIQLAEQTNRIIYISGPVAFGKTASVQYYYRNVPYLHLSGESGCLKEKPDISEICQNVIVIDDISWITEQESKDYILEMIKKGTEKGIHIVLIGRSVIPSWLRLTALEQSFILADENDLLLEMKEIQKLFEVNQVQISQDEVKKILEISKGYALAIHYMMSHMAIGEKLNEQLVQEVHLDIFHYYEVAFYEKWDDEMKKILLDMCQYDTFTIEMTEMITGSDKIAYYFEKALTVGKFLKKKDANTYYYEKLLRKFFRWKQDILFTDSQKKDNFMRAAQYFEKKGEIMEALNYYKKADNQKCISELLEKNAQKHPGIAHFFETRKYYFELPEEIVKESPLLISGLSMIYALIMQVELSEKWYDELKKYEKRMKKGSFEKREARIRIAYLDIALPHRGIHGVINMLRSMAILVKNKEIVLPEFSVTSNMPSVMNGGLDFSEWSRNDKELGILLKKPIETVLGKYGKGIVNVALAESGMENGSMDTYEIVTRLNAGYMMSDCGGKIEVCFAATGLLVKEHIVNAQMKLAEEILERFKKKAIDENAIQLFESIDTLKMWINLMKGENNQVEKWLEHAPDELHSFCILNRYQYINKVRALIALGKNVVVIQLIEKLNVYFEEYERHYLWIENQILKAIALYRLSRAKEEWSDALEKAMKKAERYHFVRIFAMEGIALKEILDHYENENHEVSEKFFDEIKTETEKMALQYPNYLKVSNISLEKPLTETEKKVLKFMCDGLTSKEICEICCFTYNSFKFHSKNIYRKLGVKNRQEAEREAVRLRINE